MDQKQKILNRLAEMELSPKRSLGQNFLVSESVIHRILAQVRSYQPQNIIEIGPGLGSLTEGLQKLGCPLKLIELDREFAGYWKRRSAHQQGAEMSSLEIVEGDALQFEEKEWVWGEKTLLVSNLPYQIGARVVIDRSCGPLNIQRMVLMFQKEVAQRLAAEPSTKDYGFLTVVAQAEWKIHPVTDAGSHDFYPPPRVTSRVLAFERKNHVVDDFFVSVVKKAFSQRRKFMLKSFAAEKEMVLTVLQALGYDEKVRAEEIQVEHYIELVKKLRKS